MTPIADPNLANRIEQILQLQLKDNQLRWLLKESGEYIKVPAIGDRINNHTILENYVTKIHDKTRKEAPDYVRKLAGRLLKES
jgi:polyphosphate kinase